MEYYVYVKFLEDDVKKIAKSRNVKGFHPADVDDFSAGEIYSVYWKATKKLAEAITTPKYSTCQSRKKVKEMRMAAKKRANKEILAVQENRELKEELEAVKKENSMLQHLNMKLQEQLLKCLSAPAARVSNEASIAILDNAAEDRPPRAVTPVPSLPSAEVQNAWSSAEEVTLLQSPQPTTMRIFFSAQQVYGLFFKLQE
ncbi:hypothetical protein V5799_024278 [Amblyomma americanum]|uniref:Uncharacterized protein n=1 Tax=Amblyomma americanum TaxID=6943 RepID=A0AAQ4ED01_AMBAM